jgi:hypothetical protein
MTWQSQIDADPIQWLLASEEPWTRYRTMLDLQDLPADHPQVQAARAEMLQHPSVQALAAETATWGDHPFKRHNDASYPIYSLSTLADFGLQFHDAGALPALGVGLRAVLAHQSPEGAFETVVQIPVRFGGSGQDQWTWILCDSPTLLYALLAMGSGQDPRVQRAVEHLAGTVEENGWHCVASPELGGFRGPGKRTDPCPIANVYALKALVQVQDLVDSPATRTGAEVLLRHWECQAQRKLFLFGVGTDYRKLKYPYVWYNILHVVEVLSQLPFVYRDPRFREMVDAVRVQADEDGRFTASSMYRAWKDWSFADKKNPSPWLTFLCCRVLKRVYG